MVAPLWALNTIKKLCSPKKWTKVHQFFRGCYPLRPPIMPYFIEISQTSLEKSVIKRYLFGPSRHFLSQTDRNVTTWVASRSMRKARLKIDHIAMTTKFNYQTTSVGWQHIAMQTKNRRLLPYIWTIMLKLHLVDLLSIYYTCLLYTSSEPTRPY